MTPEQVGEKVIQLIHRQPFVPFVVEMVDGQTLEIPHPRLAINGGGAVFFGPEGRTGRFRVQKRACDSFDRRRGGAMTADQLDRALQGYCRRRPFRRFLIEFDSGHRVAIVHPEAFRREADLYVVRLPDGGHVVFPTESVSRLLDPPVALSKE